MKILEPFLNKQIMKITSAQKVKLGLFVIITSLLLVLALYVIGKKQNIFGNTFDATAIFSNVNGLKLGNNVRYSGVQVGTVRNIKMINDSIISVDMAIESSILKHIRKDAKAVIGSDGIVGSMVVNIFPGTKNSPLLEPGDTLLSKSRVSTTDMISTLDVTNKNVATLSEELLQITSSLNRGKGTLGLLINDEEMGADLKATVGNLKKVSEEASVVVSDIRDVISDVNFEESLLYVLVNDSLAAEQFRSILLNLEESSKEVNTMMTNLNKVVLEVKEGEGTFHHIMTDTIMVNDIDETIKNIKQGSVLLNENLEAMRQNVLFRKYFKKQEKELKKEEEELEKELKKQQKEEPN